MNRVFSNVNDKIDIGVSLGNLLGANTTNNLSANENLLNNLQLRFSYRLLNDRLRVSRDGGFTYGQSQASAASLLGEWTLEYWLTPNGQLRLKMYNRNQQSALGQSIYNSATLTTSGGLSMLYTRSFNHFFGGKPPKPGVAAPANDTQPAPPTTGTQPLAVPPISTSVGLSENQ